MNYSSHFLFHRLNTNADDHMVRFKLNEHYAKGKRPDTGHDASTDA